MDLVTYEKLSTDPWYFLDHVYTKDQVDKKMPIKKFPTYLEYLRLWVRVLQKKHKVLAPKTRRMKMSWTTIGFYTHEAAFNIGRHYAYVSKKETDSDELVQRSHFILENLHRSGLPKEILPRYEKTFNRLRFPEIDTVIEGYPSGADQLRQFTFSGILADEMAFWDNAEDMYSAAYPTLEGGGRFTGISSPAPGFFNRLVFDQLDSNRTLQDGGAFKRYYPMTGVEIWENPSNQFTVVQLHYTADPAKRDPEWKKRAKAGMPIRKWNQEYELQWESWSGLPVYGDWDEAFHTTEEQIEPWVGLPLLRGWDFGLTPSCIVGQMQEDQLVILREFTAHNMGVDRFSKRVLEQLAILYPRHSVSSNYLDFVDPSGFFRGNDKDATATVQVLADQGLTPIGGTNEWVTRRESVEFFLTTRTAKGSRLLVCKPNCKTLVQGFNGGYQYPETANEKEPLKLRPIKNAYSHPHDALQYLCSGVKSNTRERFIDIPNPTFAFNR